MFLGSAPVDLHAHRCVGFSGIVPGDCHGQLQRRVLRGLRRHLIRAADDILAAN